MTKLERSEPDPLAHVVRGSHRTLVPMLRQTDSPPGDLGPYEGLVVVPLSRPEPTLETAAAIALDLEWDLLLLCSRGNQARRAQGLVARASPDLPLTAADVLHRDLLRAPREWRTGQHAAARQRPDIIQMIIAELRRRLTLVATEAEHTRLTNALAAILESRHQLTRATPESLADFVRRWRHDEELWREFLGRLPHRETLKEALVYLGLHESWIVTS